MCGIAGALSARDVREAVELMTAALWHRGPDDGGLAQLAGSRGSLRGVFGNRRLAILDLSPAGHLPMVSADGRFTLGYNGEIYNFQKLRDQLHAEGAHFRGTGDAEVVIEGWARWGPDLLPRLRGMFALAIWDRESERCYLARDTFGIKPLYLGKAAGTVLFASEVRALLVSGIIARTISPLALRSYLETGSVAEPLTIIDGIEAVPAGSFVTIDCRSGSPVVGAPRQFAEPMTIAGPMQTSHPASPDDLRRALRDSVSHHLVSDVPVALFLSGGLDSSSVVAVASEVSDTPLETFTVTFDEEGYSEAAPARAVAEKFSTRHHEIPVSGNDLLSALPDAFAAMDQPSLDGLNTYVVSRAVHESGIKVVLSGLGGDELFGGYPSFQRASLAGKVWPLRAIARRLLSAAASITTDSRMQRIAELFSDSTPARGAYRASRTLFDDLQVRWLVGSATEEPRTVAAPGSDESLLSLLQQVSLLEATGYMRNTLLRDSDVFSMAHGLELRVPFVDSEVARVAMRFPDSQKLRQGVSKPILVNAMQDILPASLLDRPKQGFTLPFERWMRNELFGEIDSVLTSSTMEDVGLNDVATALVWSAFQARRPGINWSRPWALYTLKRWADQNDVSFGQPSPRTLPSPVKLAAGR